MGYSYHKRINDGYGSQGRKAGPMTTFFLEAQNINVHKNHTIKNQDGTTTTTTATTSTTGAALFQDSLSEEEMH
jgi:hypothetical protein